VTDQPPPTEREWLEGLRQIDQPPPVSAEQLARATIFESEGHFESDPAVIVARAFLDQRAELQAAREQEGQAWTEYNDSESERFRLAAELQAAQEREANLLAELRQVKRERDTYATQLHLPPLAAQRTEEAGG